MDNCIMIAITEIKTALQNKQQESIQKRLSFAMIEASNHWLVTKEDEQFQAAVGAVLLTANDDEKERINAELKILRALNAAVSGIPIDFDRVDTVIPKPIGLTKLWREVKSV